MGVETTAKWEVDEVVRRLDSRASDVVVVLHTRCPRDPADPLLARELLDEESMGGL